jgi:hypothetical protein
MNYKKISVLIFVLSIIVLFLGIFDLTNLCNPDCDEFILLRVISIPFTIISLILYFSRKEVFITWKRFAVWAFPIMLAILIYTYSTPEYGGWGPEFFTDQGLSTTILPPLFLLISFIIIFRKHRKLKKGE